MDLFYNIEFLDKQYFLLLVFLPFLIYFYYKKLKTGLNFLFLEDLKKVFIKNYFIFYLKILLLSLIFINFVIIIANPNTSNVSENISKNGIDIVIALDISWSMEAADLKPSRLEAAKKVISDFVSNLKSDRLWLVVFSWKPFTSIPLTFDYNIISETVWNLSIKTINQQVHWLNWTAVWDAILMSKTLFKAPKNTSEEEYSKREKIIILLTDWDANMWVDPILAWLSAKEENIKIFPIWIWSKEGWYIYYNVWPFKKELYIPPLNDDTLIKIANETSWSYFKATDNNSLKAIFKELEKLQKNDIDIEIKKVYKQYYEIFLYSLMILIFVFLFINMNKLEVGKKR